MAIKPRDNETFYREVDEELRKEQLSSLWKRYGILAIAALVLLLAGIGGAIWWRNHQQAKAGERGEALIAAFDDVQARRLKEVPKQLDTVATEGSSGYRAAALLTKADVAIQQNDLKAAAAYAAEVKVRSFPTEEQIYRAPK